MKKLLVFLLCLIMCGCTLNTGAYSSLDGVFAEEKDELGIRHNNFTRYVDYYLPSDVSEMECDELSHVFMYNRSRMVMDVNIAAIINDRYYSKAPLSEEGFFDSSKLVYSRDSSFLDSEGQEREYVFRVYEYDGEYLLYFVCHRLVFYGYADGDDLIPLASRMLLMSRTASVKTDDIVSIYSNKEVIDYEKKQVNLFETIMPVNGQINDFLIGESKQGDDE